MGWRNPPIPWSELERRLSGRPASAPGREGGRGSRATDPWPVPPHPPHPRPAPEPVARPSRPGPTVPYAELHCHSNFSFLDGASHPEELAGEAVRLGLEALALTDHDGLYGVVRFAGAARSLGLPTVLGAELTLDGPRRSQAGVADPEGSHLVVLARDPAGYARLSRAIAAAHLGAGEKGVPRAGLADLAGAHGGHWAVLTGCRKGAVPAALEADGPRAAARELARLVEAFGRQHVLVELWDHGHPLDSARNDALAALAASAAVELVATSNVHYAAPPRRRLATALAAVRARRSLDDMDGWLPAGATAHLRSGPEQARRFARWPTAVAAAAELGRDCAFDLALVAPRLPDFPVPAGHTEMTWLRTLAWEGAERRYGHGSELAERARAQIAYELGVIEALGFPGYFLVVHDIVEFCRRHDIYCQGRGSAANSAVCYALGITAADAVGLGLLFERFLSPERDGPPDIDLDIESGRREEVIQYVYRRYGRHNAAQVANVITYRARSALRDVGKALGHPQGAVDAWTRHLDGWSPLAGGDVPPEVPPAVVDLATELEGFPRHLGIHSGGMVICDRPVVEVCPVEWARMEGRTVLQWDKDDCAAVGLVKIDLLGLGMLSALHLAVDLVAAHHGVRIDLATIPQEEGVYDMLCAADSVGVFQVESRAQMATLPRLRPRTFYDLVVEVALIRPGPIQGGSVHPYLRRRRGDEAVTYLHPLLEPSLGKTLGVPLFQEQLMQMAIDVAGFSAAEADELRQAMGSKRSTERMEALRGRLYAGMAERGITGEVADAIWEKLAAFANFGFPESHSVSFAYLVYASAWIKLHYPDAFLAALLNAQPMGFYSPNTLVADARRHGVEVRGPDVNDSGVGAVLLAAPTAFGTQPGPPRMGPQPHPPPERGDPSPTPGRELAAPTAFGTQPGPPRPAPVRLGLSSVRNLGDGAAERIVAGQPYASMEDLVRRSGLGQAALEALATAGALASLGEEDRRSALWSAGPVSQATAERLPGIVVGSEAPPLVPMTALETLAADLWATGVSPDRHPVEFARDRLDAQGAVTVAALPGLAHGSRVAVGGIVTHRQRPATAGGTIFLNLEDETGMANVICSRGVWARYRGVARGRPALVVRGRLELGDGAVNLVAERITPLRLASPAPASRDFR